MHTYKPGDKVRILKAVGCKGYDHSDEYAVGDICEVKGGTDGDGDTQVYTKDKSDYFYFAQDAIEPAVKTWDTLSEGDVLVKEGADYERIVQGVLAILKVWYDQSDNQRSQTKDEAG